MASIRNQDALKVQGRAVMLVLALCIGHALAQQQQQPPIIREIDVQPPAVAETYGEMIDANMTTEVGERLDPKVLSEDIKRLYKTGKFQTVETRVTSIKDGAARLILDVEIRPVVRRIEVKGNQRLKDKKIRREIEHGEGAVLDEEQLSQDAEKIRSLYRDKGYVETKVTFEKEEIGADAVDVVFQIAESGRSKVRKVTFEGNSVFSGRQLRKTIQTRAKWLAYLFNTGFLHEAELTADRQRLQERYADAGYLDFVISDIEREYSDNRNWVRLHFDLEEGQPYTVSDVSVSGNQKFGAEELLELIPLEEGERFRRQAERDGAQAINNKYHQQGYLEARATPERDVNPAEHTVAVQYQIMEGVPSTIREIHIEGNRITEDRVIRRELGVYPGEPADKRKIDAAKKRLRNLGHFSSAEIMPLVTEEADERDLRVVVEETETGRLMLGGGFSTDDDLVGMFEVSQSNFSLLNWPTFRGAGQKLRLRAQLGTERNDFVLSFVEPWLFHKRLRLSADLYARDREYDEYTEEKAGVTLSLARSWRKNWRQSIGVRFEDISLTDFSTNSNDLLDEEGDYGHHALLVSLTRDTRDSFRNPRRGSRLRISTELMSEAWGSYGDVYRLRGTLHRYFPLFEESALKIGGEIANADGLDGDRVPIIDRYFAGGSNSLRGFELRDVGPLDPVTDDPLGGQSLLLGGIELRVPLVEMVIGRAFFDFGNVWEDSAEWNLSELNASVGLGVELRLPIGPVTLDYGIPVVTEQDQLDDGGRLHFNMGYTF
ncbi:MAG: outer membrane protein assembly factor BamA [Verrucomicrobiota bacterium]